LLQTPNDSAGIAETCCSAGEADRRRLWPMPTLGLGARTARLAPARRDRLL